MLHSASHTSDGLLPVCTPALLTSCVLNSNRKGNSSELLVSWICVSQVNRKKLSQAYVMLCRSSVSSSTLPHARLAGVSSLTFSAVAVQSFKDKDRRQEVMGTDQLISYAYFVKKCAHLSCNLAPYFSSSHNSFSPRTIIHPHQQLYQPSPYSQF